LRDFPLLENYYSDYLQLTILLDKGKKYLGAYLYTEDAFGIVYSQELVINLSLLPNPLKKWNKFIKEFSKTWLHEYFHLIGLTEEGIKKVRKIGFKEV